MTVAVETIEITVADPEQDDEINFAFDWQGGSALSVTLWSSTAALADRVLTHGTEWTATPAARASGGVVTLLADPTGYDRLTIRRATPVTQDFEAPPTAAGFEAALDRLTMAVQERQGEHLGAVLAPSGVQGLRLPGWDAGALLGWAADEAALVNVDPEFGVPAPGGVIGEENGGTGYGALAEALAAGGWAGVRTPAAHGGDVEAAIGAGVTLIEDEVAVPGGVRLRDGATVIWRGGAWSKQTGFSVGGAFFSNVGVGDDTAESITLINAHLDLTDYPEPVSLEVASQSGATVTLTSAASATDDAYTGRYVQVTAGASRGAFAVVLDYVGATRTLTLSATVALSAGDLLNWGWNDVAAGFATGASDVTILGGKLKGPGAGRFVPAMSGGKGVGLDYGVTRALAQGFHAEGWEHSAVFVQGRPIAGQASTEIRLPAFTAYDCGALLCVFGLGVDAAPTGNAFDVCVVADNLMGHNVGHVWTRYASDPQKGGIIVCGKGGSLDVGTVQTRNGASYPDPASWPASDSGRIGAGLSGRVGAAFRGWGRRIRIGHHRHQGDLDAVVHVGRARAYGDDAPPTGQPRACVDWDMTHDIYGDATLILNVDNGLAADVPAAELSGYLRSTVTSCGAFCADTAGAYADIVLDVTERGTGKRVIGTPAQFVVRGRTFADYPPGVTDLRRTDRRVITLANNGIATFTPLREYGQLKIESANSQLNLLVSYRVTVAGAQCEFLGNPGGATNVRATGSLASVTTPSVFIVSADTGVLHFRNNRGGDVTFIAETGVEFG